jgi:hypothetical protein
VARTFVRFGLPWFASGSVVQMSTREFFLDQAARCRRLAGEILDHLFQERLLEIAEEFETEARNVEQRCQQGTRSD